MSEVAVREIEPRAQYFNHLVAQEGPFTTFSNIYAERNLLTAPMLDGRFNMLVRTICVSSDSRIVLFPKTNNWQTAGGETLEFNTFHLTTPSNLAALTRPY